MLSPYGGRGCAQTDEKNQRKMRQITADTCTDQIPSPRANRNLFLPLILNGNVLCRHTQRERQRIRLACHPAHPSAHMSDSLLRKMAAASQNSHTQATHDAATHKNC